MQLLKVPVKQGYIWFRQGLWIFRRNPIIILMLVFLYLLLVQLALFIPIIGILVVLVSTPGISLSFMSACRDISNHQPVKVGVLFQSYRQNSQTTQRLLSLGLMYAGAVLLISLLIVLFVDLQSLVPMITQQQPLTQEAMQQLYTALLAGGLLYIPIAMLMWFTPLLIAWHNLPISKALFFSYLACWRNRNAFMLYLGIWISAFIILPMLLENIFKQLGIGGVANLFLTPYTIFVIAILYCSFYPTWKDCFQENDNQT